jgi:hypothetical protein
MSKKQNSPDEGSESQCASGTEGPSRLHSQRKRFATAIRSHCCDHHGEYILVGSALYFALGLCCIGDMHYALLIGVLYVSIGACHLTAFIGSSGGHRV